MEENRIYNYFYTFEEFQVYLEGKQFVGLGISSHPDPNFTPTNAPKISLRYDLKKGLLLKDLGEKEPKLLSCNTWSDDTWNRKEDLFEWKPNEKDQVYFQALDRNRLHMHWKSDLDIPFSGILHAKKKGFLARLFG
ncbi:hypothetical protein EHQ53_18335 [Leptospira langatensis]|uniref:Uncharacterized protein n=1 Tax=Leptospira langatensis TaxID=2484983 RepID=A0A5F1ZPC1_9LEPT|nr:hypothetical protein [Leptospira langatensis]TGK05577.1 hypothetical protein EHO57_02575 [Leptospira langatensis]TGL38709.1 hypothetical protein EHQ53_18335 [Leptospira langatensis]